MENRARAYEDCEAYEVIRYRICRRGFEDNVAPKLYGWYKYCRGSL
jgi:hypothetical protein